MPFRALPRLAAITVVLALAGCGGSISPGTGSLSGGNAITYQPSNAVFPNGYSETMLGPDKYRVRAIGDAGQSRAVLEKLAVLRAADIGQNMNLKYFKVDSVSENLTCGSKKTISGRDPKELVIKSKRMVDVDVSYAKDATDPQWLASKDAFPVLRGELDALAASDPGSEAARAEVAAKCGA